MDEKPWQVWEEVGRKSARGCGAVMMAFSPLLVIASLSGDEADITLGVFASLVFFLAGLYQWRRRRYLLDYRYWKKSS